MISGFVILMSVQRLGSGRSAVWAFFKSRAIRLYPAFWVACTLTFVLVKFASPGFVELSWARYILNMTMLNGFFNIGNIDGVYWTLFAEIRFYILIGLLLWFNKMNSLEVYMGAWLLVGAINYFWQSSVIEYLLLTKHCGFFVAGCAWYLVRTSGLNAYRFALLVSAFLVAFAYEMRVLEEKQAHYNLSFEPVVLLCAMAVFFALFGAIGRVRQPDCKGLLMAMGGISYPLYLLHAYIGFTLFYFAPAGWSGASVVSLTMVAMLAGSYVMWKYIEPRVAGRLRVFFKWAESRYQVHAGAV